MLGAIVQVLREGRAGTATLCCLDAKVTSLIAHRLTLRGFLSLASFRKRQHSRKLRHVTMERFETQVLMFTYCKISESYHSLKNQKKLIVKWIFKTEITTVRNQCIAETNKFNLLKQSKKESKAKITCFHIFILSA